MSDRQLERRALGRRDVDRLIESFRTWGRWGDDDELGAANHLTPEIVAAALALPSRGAVFSLSLPLERGGPTLARVGRTGPQHIMLRHGGDVAMRPGGAHGVDYTDDAIYMPLQSATQWDGLCHVFFDGKTYNGRGPESVGSNGALHNSITNLVERSVARGVLLDVPRWLGREHLEAGEAIQAEDLEACAAHQGVEVRTGDFVLVRTGHMKVTRASGSWDGYLGGPAPGLGLSAAEFLCPRNVVAVATDTALVEVFPYEVSDVKIPLHVVLLVNAGVYLGEMWDLEALAEDCAADGVYEFLLVAPPLDITGAVGSPVTPLAIK